MEAYKTFPENLCFLIHFLVWEMRSYMDTVDLFVFSSL